VKHAAKEHHYTELDAFQPAYEYVQQDNRSQFESNDGQRDTQMSPTGESRSEERYVDDCGEQGFERKAVGSVQEPKIEPKERHGEARCKRWCKLQLYKTPKCH